MTPQQLLAIRAHIDATPTLAAQPMTADGAWAIAEALNGPGGSAHRERFVSARTVLAEVGLAGASALDKLQAFSDSAPPVEPSLAAIHSSARWAMRFVTSDGIDVGHPTTRSLLDALAAAGVLTQAEANSIKALALQPQTVAEGLLAPWRGRVSYQDVEAARAL